MTNSPDWQKIEETLFEQAKAVIRRMEVEQSNTAISFFAFYAEPLEGRFELHIDTPENAIQVAMRREQTVLDRRRKMLGSRWSWMKAHSYIDIPRLYDYSYNVTYFHFHALDSLLFDECLTYFDSDEYPKGREGIDDDYFRGNVRLIFWHLAERLVNFNAFAQLHLASPFRIGYQFYDDDLITLRFLNWHVEKNV